MPKSDSGILLMAAEHGFFKQVGLNVQIVPIKDDEILLKALIAGDLDSFEGGPGSAMIADFARRRRQGDRLQLAGRAARHLRSR